MKAPEALKVDLADVSDIKEKLPRAEAILFRMEEELRHQQGEIDRWRNLVSVLRSVAGTDANSETPPEPTLSHTTPSPVQDLVVEVVNRAIRAIRSRDVRVILAQEGHLLSSESVSNALWNAAENALLIRRVSRGWYAPLAYALPPGQTSPA